MRNYPVKECDYCDHVGTAYTFADGETICATCLGDLGANPRALRLRVRELQEENGRLLDSIGKYKESVFKLHVENVELADKLNCLKRGK